jgi:hypothetical protein
MDKNERGFTMNAKTAFVAFALVIAAALLTPAGPAYCDRTVYLTVCQELVTHARAYEARANFHNQVCKNLMVQIEAFSKLAKNQGTISAIDTLFKQYDENRALETKFRQLFRKSSDEADKCMKTAE